MMFSSTKWLLIGTGSWNLELSDNLRLPYKIYEFFMRLIFVWAYLIINICLVQNIGVDNEKAVNVLSIAIHITCCTFKLIICMRRRMVQLVKTAFEDNFEGNARDQEITKILKNYKRYVRNINLSTLAYILIVLFIFCVTGSFVEYHNFQKSHPNITERPEYIIATWMPFDIQKHFTLALAIQSLVYANSGAMNCSSLALFNSLMVYVVIKLRILQHKFMNFDNYLMETEKELVTVKMAPGQTGRNLKELIREHQNLIRFVQELNDNIKYGIFVEYSFTSLMLASILMQLINGYRQTMFAPYFVLLTSQLVFFSYNAEEISYQSRQIGNTIYASDWYLHGEDVKRLVHMIMKRSQKQLCLTIGPFGPNSLNAAMTRLKLAYSYTSVMSGNHV